MRWLCAVGFACWLTWSCSPPPPPPPPDFEAFSLADAEARELRLTLEEPGEAVLELEGSAPDTSWGTAERESIVLAITVDGRVRRHVVWTSPQATVRGVLVGQLEAGEHVVEVERVSSLSRDRSGALELTGASLKRHPDQQVARYAPIIMGRDDSATSDLPVLLLARKSGTSIEYTVVFTNEDGGTGLNPKRLVALWGRLHDIERVTTAENALSGGPVTHAFQDPFHGTRTFAGVMEGDHPVLRVATTNGLFVDDAQAAKFRLAEPPLVVTSVGEPRERVLDEHPWTHALAEAEGVREGKVDPACTDPEKVWALDCYVFADVASQSAQSLRPVWGLEARTATGAAFRSEAGLGADGRMDRDGIIRFAIPVGRGVDVKELRAYAVHDGGDPFAIELGARRVHLWRDGQLHTRECGGEPRQVGSDVADAVLCTW